ncbi:MFS transporter (plasmid) [Priestia endophytica]|uniref:MFS transporter n=1 Tax=Priestia endophytica TaxID=135735 RepID=UPI000DCA3B1D|nr:MFS transporter [Priestia endophytica]RAS90858.1 MFS transporter [Priestia endophytica]
MGKHKELILIISLLIGTFLVPINSTMIAVALSTISAHFNEPLANISWVVTIYLIVMAVTQPIAGKLGDIYGNRSIYLWGILFFLIASLGCIFSTNLLLLIIFRSMQAVGGALLTPNTIAIIRYIVPKERLSKVLGVFGMGMGLGAAIGPLLGSVLIENFNLESIFWVNVPFLFVALIGGIFMIPKFNFKRGAHSLDIQGSLYLAISISLLILLTHNLGLTESIIMGIVFILSLILFIKRENTAENPIIDFSLFKNASFTSANLSILLSNFVMYVILLIMPLLMKSQFHLSTGQTGVVLSIFSISMSLSGWIGGLLNNKFGSKKVIGFSFAMIIFSNILFLYLGNFASIIFLIVALIIGGFSTGVGLTSMQVASLDSVNKELSGTASGIYSTFRYFGSIISSTLIALVTSYNYIFIVLGVSGILGLIVAGKIKSDDQDLIRSNNSSAQA